MSNILLRLSDQESEQLKAFSSEQGLTVSEILRRKVREVITCREFERLGAVVEAVYAQTSSGMMFVGKGF
jgi:hypothetical protein